jgi:hypothetical protein
MLPFNRPIRDFTSAGLLGFLPNGAPSYFTSNARSPRPISAMRASTCCAPSDRAKPTSSLYRSRACCAVIVGGLSAN